MEPINLGDVRAKKAERCEYCGQAEHPSVFACPRIKSITYDNENDTVTVRLWGAEREVVPPGAA